MNIKRKINIDDLLLSVFIVITTFMLMMVSSYFVKKNDIDKLTNELYSSTSIHFGIKDSKADQHLNSFIKETKNSNYTLFKENVGEKHIRGVYSSQSINNIPMKSGRFFQKEDFFHNKKLAVVGKDFKDIKNINEKKCFNYQGYCFEIIGVIGTEVKSNVDNMVYLNLDALFDLNFSSTGIYVLDSGKNTQISYEKLKTFFMNDDSIFQIENKVKGTERLFKSEEINNKILTFLSIIVLTMNILFSSYWIYKKRILIAMQYLIGHRSFVIYSSVCKKYMFISLGSYVAGILLFLIFNIDLYMIHSGIYHKIFLIGLLYMIIFTLGLFLLSSLIYSSKNCMKVLKSN